MTPRFVFRPRAVGHLREARRWYAAQAPGLELEFARAVEAAVGAVGRNPEAYPEVEPRIRRILLRRFPYGMYYAIEADRIVIHACYHVRRDPTGWQSRR
jgi:toxin ParE1/3/4